ncbi:hypothetical protein [Methanoculleus horonobensis]|uniref:hypothetical protein n=1 Tax=Methanoculleus horonobensis TaxID=528314 RepID=UPI00129033A7|nr:hypothetical protein [Methanoculleus horonobensis]
MANGDYIEQLNSVIIAIMFFGFIFGLSLGLGVKIPTEGDILIIIYDGVSETVSSSSINSNQASEDLQSIGGTVRFVAFLLFVIPIILAIVLWPWGIVLLIDSVIAGWSLGLWATNQAMILMYLGVVSLSAMPLIAILIQNSRRWRDSENSYY